MYSRNTEVDFPQAPLLARREILSLHVEKIKYPDQNDSYLDIFWLMFFKLLHYKVQWLEIIRI